MTRYNKLHNSQDIIDVNGLPADRLYHIDSSVHSNHYEKVYCRFELSRAR